MNSTPYPPNENHRDPIPIFICMVGGGCTQAIALHISLGVKGINKGSLGVCRGIYCSSCLNSTANDNHIVSTFFMSNYLRDKPQCLKFLQYSVAKCFSQHRVTSLLIFLSYLGLRLAMAEVWSIYFLYKCIGTINFTYSILLFKLILGLQDFSLVK